jgi:hypothetical protein
MLSLYLTSALIMFILEYFVLLKLYKRPKNIETISLIVAPLMIVVALWITLLIQKQFKLTLDTINPAVLFFVLVLLELPLSLYGYELTPNASILERVIVAGTFGVASVLIANAILQYF